MKRGMTCLLLMLLLLLGSGCTTIESIIHIKADGSGTMTNSILINCQILEQVWQQIAAMAGSAGAKQPPPPELDKLLEGMFSEQQARNQAATMGEGVSFLSCEKLANGEQVGYKAVYAFQDIRKLKLALPPPAGLGANGSFSAVPEKPLSAFQFQPLGNGHVLLTMPFNLMAKANKKRVYTNDDLDLQPEKPTLPQQTPSLEQIEKVSALFKGMKVHVAIDVQGKLVETNCPLVQGNQVTLLNLDFDEMMKSIGDPAKLQSLLEKKPNSIEEVGALLKDIKGIQVPLISELRIEFSGQQ